MSAAIGVYVFALLLILVFGLGVAAVERARKAVPKRG
ncbi:Uncharacterised protein [Mycobacteroides abscessus subsp. abscessus]|nr:Uncharacterised protein [Mycobacteroides abscessus subsp. abscessus]